MIIHPVRKRDLERIRDMSWALFHIVSKTRMEDVTMNALGQCPL